MKKIRVPQGVFNAAKVSFGEVDAWQELTSEEKTIFNISDFIELKIWIRVGNYDLPKQLIEKLRKWMLYYMPKELNDKNKRALAREGIFQSDIDWVIEKEPSLLPLIPIFIGILVLLAIIISIKYVNFQL